MELAIQQTGKWRQGHRSCPRLPDFPVLQTTLPWATRLDCEIWKNHIHAVSGHWGQDARGREGGDAPSQDPGTRPAPRPGCGSLPRSPLFSHLAFLLRFFSLLTFSAGVSGPFLQMGHFSLFVKIVNYNTASKQNFFFFLAMIAFSLATELQMITLFYWLFLIPCTTTLTISPL